MALNCLLGVFSVGVMYTGEWIDCAPHFLYAPKTIDPSAFDAIENPTTKDVKRLASKETCRLSCEKMRFFSFWPMIGLFASSFGGLICPDMLMPVLVLLACVCAYPYLNEKRERLYIDAETEQWEDWQATLLARLRASNEPSN